MDDLISRQAAIDAMSCINDSICEGQAIDALSELPTIDPMKHGKWMPHPTEADWDVCSVCGIGTHIRSHGYHNGAFWDAEESYAYCPHCGARMDG